MPKLVNIAKTEDNKVKVDPSVITALVVKPEDNELLIFSDKGVHMYVDYKKMNIDPAEAAQKLKEAGVPMVLLTTSGVSHPGHQRVENLCYISPAAVTYAVPKLLGEGRADATVGVKGYGAVRSVTTNEEMTALLDAVRDVKKLLFFRWTDPAGLYIDPLSVTRIDNRLSRNVHFEGSGTLDVRTLEKRYDANEIYRSERDKFPTPAAAFEEAARRKDEAIEARFAFTDKIAAANSSLISLSSPEYPVYIRKEDFGYTREYDDPNELATHRWHLIVCAPGIGMDRPDDVVLKFKTAKERDDALERLEAALDAPAQQLKQARKAGPRR